MLAEDPVTGKVEVERVQAVRKDPVSPLTEVRLSDGSSIKVTVDHPFWIDGNADFANAGRRPAGQLQVGDRLRTASGADSTVVGMRYQV
jgi:intein/homing endonuclease